MIASYLKQIFPSADRKVLTDPARLVRTPGGERSASVVQEVEATNARVALQTLTQWIQEQDVIKNKGIKI